MVYQLQRLFEFAAVALVPNTEVGKFIDLVQKTETGSIVGSDDRIRFAASNTLFRFRTCEDVRRACDLLEDFYATSASKPTIQCDE